MIKENKLIDYLNSMIKQEESTAEELIQDCDNPEEADKCFARMVAYNNVILLVNEKSPLLYN